MAVLIDYFGWSWHEHILGALLQARMIFGRRLNKHEITKYYWVGRQKYHSQNGSMA